jgi:uncharacterized protein involved in exopolysaccharide biosynthesis/Mrp family chromosome partitioning ATPase
MDLVYLFRILYRRIWILVTVPIVAGLASFLFTQDLEKEYKSSAQLSTGFTTNNKVQLTKENFDYWESKSNFENLVEMMKSELIGSMVTYSLILHDLSEEIPFRYSNQSLTDIESDSIKNKLTRKIKSFELLSSYNEYEKGIIELMNKHKYNFTDWIKDGDLVITRIKDTDFIRVEFTSENPFLSAFVVNKLCEEYIRYNSIMKNMVTEESLLFFANEVEKKKKELDDKTREVNEYKTSSQVFDYERESNSRLNQLTDYEIKLQTEENNANGLIISLRSVESKISSLSRSTENSNNSKLLELRHKINELNKIYADSGGKNKELENTINDLRNQLQLEKEKLDVDNSSSGKKPKTLNELLLEKDDLELQLAITNSNIESIRNKVAALKNSVSTIGSKEYVITSLESERENAFKDYTNSVEKFNDVKSRSSISGGGVKLMITGQPNPEPESTKRLAFIAISIAGSMFLCIGVILGIEYFDYRLKTPERFERFTKVKLLGFLHRITFKKSGFLNVLSDEKERKEVETMMNLLRKIRFLIQNSKKQVILVSSTNRDDGKSFFIKSLAQSLSLLSVRVLIIDTNFRNNSLTQLIIGNRMLQKQSEYKLLNDSDAYIDTADEDEYSKSVIFPTTDKNVDIIGSRLGLESPSEMFAGRSFTAFIDSLRLKYDYILMEGPSLNEYSDTKELTQFADAIIAVFSAENSLTPRDRESINYLKSLNGKFAGAILNFVSKEDIGA